MSCSICARHQEAIFNPCSGPIYQTQKLYIHVYTYLKSNWSVECCFRRYSNADYRTIAISYLHSTWSELRQYLERHSVNEPQAYNERTATNPWANDERTKENHTKICKCSLSKSHTGFFLLHFPFSAALAALSTISNRLSSLNEINVRRYQNNHMEELQWPQYTGRWSSVGFDTDRHLSISLKRHRGDNKYYTENCSISTFQFCQPPHGLYNLNTQHTSGK